MENYKEDILRTRVGCVGSSDATMLAQIDQLGCVPESAKKRLAVCKGLSEVENITTRAMLYGDFIETSIYDYLAAGNKNYQSNPCIVSGIYSRKNVDCIDHIDILLKDEEKKLLLMYEVKATKLSVVKTKLHYKAQLFHHYILGHEYATKLGHGWKVKVMLVHYDTNGVDVDGEFQFDPQRITIEQVRFCGALFNMHHAMDIVNDYLETLTEYYEGDVIPVEYLPEEVRAKFASIGDCIKQINEQKKKVDEFKANLYDFFASKGIKKVEVDGFTFTLVEPSQSVTFDSKTYLSDFEAKYPRKYKALRMKYDKKITKSGYIKITEKNQ